MARTVAGKTFKDYSITVGESSLTVFNEGDVVCESGQIVLSNPNASGDLFFNLSGAAAVANNGLWLKSGDHVQIINPANNKITVIGSTTSLIVGAYAIPNQ